MFESYNLEKSFTSEYVKGRKKIANVTITLMNFEEKKIDWKILSTITTPKSKNNVSNKVVSNIVDDGVKVAKLCNENSKCNV